MTVTSENSVGSTPRVFSTVSETSAMPSGFFPDEPLKMTPAIDSLRSSRDRCSPSTQRTASITFDLPHPFGPTMAVTPGEKSTVVFWAKLLKPWRSSRLRYTRGRGTGPEDTVRVRGATGRGRRPQRERREVPPRPPRLGR